MRLFLGLLFLCFATPVWADGPIPDKRTAILRDVDFPGGDIAQIFDITLPACQAACLANPDCGAFTFNARSNACFPKSEALEQTPYQGAISALVLATSPDVLANAEMRGAELDFLTPDDLARARSQALGMGQRYAAGDWPLDLLLTEATRQRQAGDLPAAVRLTGAAITLADRDDLWSEYARLSLILPTQNGQQARQNADQAFLAATNAYLRGSTEGSRTTALSVMAEALIRQNRGRTAIPALRLAQSIQPRDDTARALDQAIARFGFRIVEHQVDSDLAQPRICAVFSEALVANGVDYGPFVQVDATGLSVEPSGQQLCIEGIEHGSRHRVTFRSGLPAASSEALSQDVTLTLYVRDRSPRVRFPGRAYVLPKTAGAALPITTVNTETVDLTLHRISDRNLLRAIQSQTFGPTLNAWSADQFTRDVGPEIWSGTGEVEMVLNRDVTTRLPMAEALQDQPPGIYALQARIPGQDIYSEPAAFQWFVVSNLGLATMSGTDGLHVFVRDLGDAQGREGVSVQLLSRANAVLGETTTDAMGYTRFDPALTRGLGGAEPAMIVAQAGDDLSFLSLTDPAFDLSDRGVEGRPAAPPIDVFLTTDRGAYRAGETIYATALARDGQAVALPEFPLTAVLTRPDGVEYEREVSRSDTAGGHVFAFDVGLSVPRGTWRLEVFADPEAPALADARMLVEDFLPERIDFDLAFSGDTLRTGEMAELTVDANYLFGAPAADLPIEGEVRLRLAEGVADHPGFRFGRHDQRFDTALRSLPGGIRTDAEGNATLSVTLPDTDAQGRPLEIVATVRMSEGSGRPVERRVTAAVEPTGPMLGLRPMFEDVVPEGGEARFQIIGLDTGGTAAPLPVTWTVNRVETRYQWYSLYGNWNWEPVTQRTRVASGEVTTANTPIEVSAPIDWGQYEIVVEHDGTSYAASSMAFTAGWYAPADATTTPDMLEVSLDRPAYRSGDTATLRIVPRAPGTALVTVMSNRLIAMETVEVGEGETLVDLPVTDEWGAGAYVSATLVRPMDVAAGRNPTRALGLAYAAVDPGEKALEVSLDVPEQAQPRAPLTVGVDVAGVQPDETAYVTLAAVDVGILNLTGFENPDLSDHYFGQRELGMGLRDLYGRLIDGLNGAEGRVRSGGDAGSALEMQSPPPTEELVTFFRGPVTVGPDGQAQVTFDLPAFNGTLRLMAVAWSDTGVGQADAEVLVRDPVVVSASLPRFLSPGDESRLLLEITHVEGAAGAMPLSVSAGSGLTLGSVPFSVALADQAAQVVEVPITAQQTGVYPLSIGLTLPSGEILEKDLQLAVQINDPPVARTSRFTLAAGDTFTFDDDVFTGLRDGTATLTIGALGQLDAPGLLTMLDRYPYGCTEQVASQAMPLLYLSSLGETMGLGTQAGLNQRINEALDLMLARQNSGGGFGLWGVGGGDLWLDAYVTDFLSRARGEGFAVPDIAFRLALDNLRNRVNYAADFETGGEDLAYALMVLAREGAAAVGDLRYYSDVKGDAFATALASAQLGAALALYGDQTRADAMFARASRQIAGIASQEEGLVWRADYGTHLRDAAGVLALATEAGSAAVDRGPLTQIVAEPERIRSTQEAVWTLLAARALVQDTAAQGFTIEGAPVEGPLVQLRESGGAPVAIRNGSPRDEIVTLTAFGVPTDPEPAGGNGYAISRSYYTMEGDPVTLDQVAVGDRLVTVLRVEPFGQSEARLMVNDPLPAGLEIDNPSLLRGGDVRALDWLQLTPARHAEFRSNRFLAAIDWRSDQAFQLAYVLRATSPGSYHHPAASVEDMYRPQYRARTEAGRVTVTP